MVELLFSVLKFKDIVDLSSLEYAKLKAICPIIVSAEFLKRAKKKFLETTDRVLRISSVASVALTPYTPVFSPQEEAQSARDNGHTLIVDTPLNLNGMPKIFEAPDGRRVIFNNIEREQVQSQEVSVFGVTARFDERGNLVLSTIDNKTRGIVLPRVSGFVLGEAKFSPDGTKIAAWRKYSDGPPPAKHDLFLIDVQTSEVAPFLPEFLENLGQFPTLLSFTWSPDGKKLAFAAGQHGGGKTVGVDIETGRVLFELRGSEFGEFSPDGNRFAKVSISGKDLEIIDMERQIITIRNNGGLFSWSSDSRFLVFTECTDWTGTGSFALCQGGNLSVYDVVNKELTRLFPALPNKRPVFSPNSKKIFFARPQGRQNFDFAVYDIQKNRISAVAFSPRDIGVDHNWNWEFGTDTNIFLYGVGNNMRLYFLWIDAETGIGTQVKWIELGRNELALVKKVLPTHIFYEVRSLERGRALYTIPLIYQNGAVRGTRVGSLPTEGPSVLEDNLFGLLKNGDLLSAGGQNFLFQGGKRYLIVHEEITEYFGGQRGSIPEGLAFFIPEGENISFKPGDAVGDKENKKFGIWYLRNGRRYWIQNWEWFLRGHRLPLETEPISVNKTILERIPEGEPTLVQKEGELGWLDWDGNFVEFQSYGGRMIIFIGGYGGSTSGQIEAFRQIKDKLVEKGWRRTQFLEATYNIDTEALRRGEIKPKEYKSEDTKVDPLLSASKLRLELRRYKEMLPWTDFIIISHSLGGPGGLEAVLAHTDSTEIVITLDSPLKGVDRVALNEHFGPDIDGIIRIMGEEVGRYLVSMAENPAARQAQEDKAAFLRSRGVRVFTFSNDDDWFIRNKVSVLDNSDSEFDGQAVELIRHLGHFSPRGPGDFISGHGQILQEDSFLEELARILPAS